MSSSRVDCIVVLFQKVSSTVMERKEVMANFSRLEIVAGGNSLPLTSLKTNKVCLGLIRVDEEWVVRG